MAGTRRELLSRSQYEKIQKVLLIICNVKLPSWKFLRSLRVSLKKKLKMTVTKAESPLGTPIFVRPIKESISLVSN